jgi:hypothetical protein
MKLEQGIGQDGTVKRLVRIFSRGLLAPAVCLLAGEAFGQTTTNVWLGRSADWQSPANWSSGVVPTAEAQDPVHIGRPEGGADPVLSQATAAGGAVRIAEGGRLDLAGFGLAVRGAAHAGMTIEPGGEMKCGDGTAVLTLACGGLVNRGTIHGRLKIHVAGQTEALLIDVGNGLTLDELRTLPSPFPYPVQIKGRLEITGNLVLAGGRVMIGQQEFNHGLYQFRSVADAAVTVRGDLVFEGPRPNVILVPCNDIQLYGTIRSEGSAWCIAGAEAPESGPVWDIKQGRALSRTAPKTGWVRMKGPGDQTLTPGGILPALAIDKPSGTVSATGDLHLHSLLIVKGNTLDLSKGQTLSLGSHLEEKMNNPRREGEPGGTPKIAPWTSNRGLLCHGTLQGGAPGVPLRLLIAEDGIAYAVETTYRAPDSGGAEGGLSDMQDREHPERAPASLAVNRLDSRLQLRGDKLLLDGKPAAETTNVKPASKTDDAELGTVMDQLMQDMTGGSAADTGAYKPKARLSGLRLIRLEPEPLPMPTAQSSNLAPLALRIDGPQTRNPVVWAVNGTEWSRSSLYDLVDGDAETGCGKAFSYDVVFPSPVTVQAARATGCGQATFTVRADITGDGTLDTLLGWSGAGVAKPGHPAPGWAHAWTVFEPVQTRRVRIEFRDDSGAAVEAALNELELFGDETALARLRQQTWLQQQPRFPADARFLEHGAAVRIEWPATEPANRVSKVVSAAFWMFHVQGDAAKRPPWSQAAHLRDYAPCVQVMDEMKNRYGFDVITLFWEAACAFHWPSTNFVSETNQEWFDKREQSRKLAAMLKPRTEPANKGDALDLLLAGAAGGKTDGMTADLAVESSLSKVDPKDLKPFTLQDLPCQRNLLAEFCELAHEKGMKVAVICRPEDLSAYVGSEGPDVYELWLKECAAAGVDLFSLTPDEEDVLWTTTRHADWKTWHAQWQQTSERLEPDPRVRHNRFIVERARLAGRLLGQQMEAVRKVAPQAKFFVDGARLLQGGAPYDIIGHLAEPDYIGCSYQSHIVRRWAATTRSRQVMMGEYTHPSVRYPIQAVLQGARAVRTYRYNYIALNGSEAFRARENRFIDRWTEWGGTRPSRPPTALLVSRASEALWPADCANGLTGTNAAERGWAVSEAVYGFLMRNGYPFDLFYLDQAEDLDALKDYRLVVVPFAYAMPGESLARLEQAYQSGARFLICERQGEVDEFGRPHKQPLLAGLIDRGARDKRVRFIRDDLLQREVERDFVPWLSEITDALLGPDKSLALWAYGHKIEALSFAPQPDERYATLMNWGSKEARIEFGLMLPPGAYTLLTLRSDDPETFRQGAIGGKTLFTAEELGRVAVTVAPGEVLAVYAAPENRLKGLGK